MNLTSKHSSLRLCPIQVFLDRLCTKHFELPPALPGSKSVIVGPGLNIWFPVYSVQKHTKYVAEPNKFDPERFMGNRKHDVDLFNYFPFVQGPRMSIRSRFALPQTRVVPFHLLAKCHPKRSSKTMVPIELGKNTFTMTVEGDFWLQLESRYLKLHT